MAAGSSGRNWPLLVVAGVLAVASIACILYYTVLAKPPEISGTTSQERTESVCRLAGKRAPGTAKALARTAANEPDLRVRRAAILCLGPYHRQVPLAVVDRCTRDAAAPIRSAAAGALARYNDEAAAKRLWEMADKDPNASVRQAALTALDGQDSPLAVVALLETAENSQDEAAKLRAGQILVDKYKINFPPDTKDPVKWKHLVTCVKRQVAVQDAYKATGRTVEWRPQDLIPVPGGTGTHH
jgi:hypothetical protein